MKSIIALYIIPTMFFGMLLVYYRENIITWILFLLCLCTPLVFAYLYAKTNGGIKGLLLGNSLYFITNIMPILYLNKIGLVKKTEEMWHGYFKPLYTEHLFVILFVVVFIVEFIIYDSVRNK